MNYAPTPVVPAVDGRFAIDADNRFQCERELPSNETLVARIPGDNGRYVRVLRDDDVGGLIGVSGMDCQHPVRFFIDRMAIATMISSFPTNAPAVDSRLGVDAQIAEMIEIMAERLALASGVSSWEKVSEPTGDEIADRETRGYWRLLARTALCL